MCLDSDVVCVMQFIFLEKYLDLEEKNVIFFLWERLFCWKSFRKKKWFFNHSNNVLENHKFVGLLLFVNNEHNSNKERHRFFLFAKNLKCVISLTSVTSDVVYIILFIV